MNRTAIEVVSRHERASATPQRELRPPPTAAASPRAKHEAPAVAEAAPDASLRGAQLWFARAVARPEAQGSVDGPLEVETRVTAGPRLSAVERLEIYRRGYHSRLIECLADDYPVLEHALGDATFHDLCAAYIASHPSERPNLNFFGRHMAAFCREEAGSMLSSPGFAGDLAALEWAIVEVIHAPSSEPLTMEALSGMPAEAWPEARLAVNTAVRLLRFDFPVNAYFQAFREGGSPELPSAQASATVVYRSGPTIWRMDLTPAMVEVLSALVSGETLAASLARAEASLAGVDPGEIAQRVTHWFREWVSSGLFAGVV